MKLSFEIDDDQLRDILAREVRLLLSTDSYDRRQGELYVKVKGIIVNATVKAFEAMDIGAMLREEIERASKQTMREVLAEHLKAEAKKALKLALAEKGGGGLEAPAISDLIQYSSCREQK